MTTTLLPIEKTVLRFMATLGFVGSLGALYTVAKPDQASGYEQTLVAPIVSPIEQPIVVQEVVPVVVPEVSQPQRTSLDDAVYGYFQDFTANSATLLFWGKPINKIPQFKGHISYVVGLTEKACEQYKFPEGVDCPELMVSLMIKESQLKADTRLNGAYGIAQMNPMTVMDYMDLPEGPKHYAWQLAKKERISYNSRHPASGRKPTQEKYYRSLLQREETAKETYYQAIEKILPTLLKDPAESIPAATAYMQHLLETFGNPNTALTHYNCGEYAVSIPSKSKTYAREIMRNYKTFSNRGFK